MAFVQQPYTSAVGVVFTSILRNKPRRTDAGVD